MPSPIEHVSRVVSWWAGSTQASLVALAVVIVLVVSGLLFRFSETWQLVVNTSTTVVTFLMVFLIQRAQNKDSRAVALKLNEIVAALEGASNHLVAVETLSEQELDVLQNHYANLKKMSKNDDIATRSHSVDEAIRHYEESLPTPPSGIAE